MEVLHGGLGGSQSASLPDDSIPDALDLDDGGSLFDASVLDARGPKASPTAAAAAVMPPNKLPLAPAASV